MNLLFYDMGSFTARDFLYYLRKAGHTCRTVYYHFPDKFRDDFFCEKFSDRLEAERYDAVISVNFFPLVAALCDRYHIPYLAWCYDSPMEEALSRYFSYETNRIFLFDRLEAERYRAAGYDRVYHLPLAVNVERLDALNVPRPQRARFTADISFVGKLYDSPLDALLIAADEHTRGYIEGVLQAQLRIYGYNFLENVITDELLDAVNGSFERIGQTRLKLTRQGLAYAIAAQITHLERSFLLEQLGELGDTRFYTTEQCKLGKVRVCGPVKYYEEMPCVFRYSKLNLNPTLKSICSGIPLRALDIMGAGGALLSNYQPELAEYFMDGEEVILYESMEDAVAKADFYLRHGDQRERIAAAGKRKVAERFTYPQRIAEMLREVELA